MDGEAIRNLIIVLAVLVANVPVVRRQWLEDREGAIKTIRLAVYYLVYIAVGIIVLLSSMPSQGGASDAKAVAGSLFMLGWVLLGVSWLIKAVPRYRPVPAWLLKPVGVLDIVALVTIAVTLPVLLFG
jgi:hypothetical protein